MFMCSSIHDLIKRRYHAGSRDESNDVVLPDNSETFRGACYSFELSELLKLAGQFLHVTGHEKDDALSDVGRPVRDAL